MTTTIKSLFNLQGKVAIVTGGAMGIGKGIALRLSEAGASVLVVDIVPKTEAQEIISELKTFQGKVEYLQVDLSECSNLEFVVEETCRLLGDLHILVNNAGIFRYKPVTDLTEELWDHTVDLNLKAPAFLSRLAVNKMIANNHGGRIINISSVDGLKPTGNLAHYDASKGGLHMLTKSFAKEVGVYGITVNEIAPGGINTPGVQKLAGENHTPEEQQAMIEQMTHFVKRLPLQRMGEPEDIGNAALFLASDASSYITGSTLVVDGGLLLM